MHVVIFGLTISSSWGNGHATLWRALVHAMAKRRHSVVFYERELPYYASTRDGWEPPPQVSLKFYESLEGIREAALADLDAADLAMFTSFCPDGPEVARLILDSRAGIKAFYDLDTPVTLDALDTGAPVAYLPAEGLSDFDLVLSYTGGRALDELRLRLGAQFVAPLYGWADPDAHSPAAPVEAFRGALSYLGTFAADRHEALKTLFFEPARRMTREQFHLAGAQYPDHDSWSKNIHFIPHLPPALHPSFFCSSRATLNVTRQSMARYGYCPSGRLFEAAACGTPIFSDGWEGLELFFSPGQEILRVDTAEEVVHALSLTDAELRRIAEAGRARVLAEHTAERRIAELEMLCACAANSAQAA
jgi:spore maturation protein CgeB